MNTCISNRQMYTLLVLMIEIAVTAFVVQYVWNNVLKKSSSNYKDDMSYMDAVLVTIAIKLLFTGVGVFADTLF